MRQTKVQKVEEQYGHQSNVYNVELSIELSLMNYYCRYSKQYFINFKEPCLGQNLCSGIFSNSNPSGYMFMKTHITDRKL